ncbi:1,4-alpha-glucan branching protein GlgB [Inmirania thermothiophila]|uniref:1,4-alpha-glucan branching enzyme GlgB n=1 Tax=Inmirania thermothiophila TaxID=1750597 RepID=A0A3N1Y1W7_9GAMM|nr:1,4-alpha-glucan branching protein GlgB [Inmirania thermothiophila]ROR32816.1 1,4-alpha-glucan branching enzyme [Inmirania thermothiophila]
MDALDPSDPEIARLLGFRHHDPFRILGRHYAGTGEVAVRALIPDAEEVAVVDGPTLGRVAGTALFAWQGPARAVPPRYRLRWRAGGRWHEAWDPYCFPPQIPDFDLHLFGEGRHWHAWRFLGANPWEADGVPGVLFGVWAPNAERVSVVGDFNGWDGRRHPMRSRGGSGVWELFLPGIPAGSHYKFELRTRAGHILLKSDPYGRWFEPRPGTAARVPAAPAHAWGDAEWMAQRARAPWLHRPMSIYEVHLGSWRRAPDGGFLGYRELAERLADHVETLGFTHVELLPVTEHPLDASWGYQTTGFFAPTSRFGTPDDFRAFVDHLHRRGIGVLLDWVPGHFPRNEDSLARFDGTPLYEHPDPRRGEHPDWGTLVFDYGRNEVRNFLLASALYWLEEFHLDGLRVDAVASMLYLDYSRRDGEWLPNVYGGRENLEAIAFLRELNRVVHERCPGAVVIAEESTAWPMVSRPTWLGGLGFSMKWNLGWMHDTLDYFGHDPIHRKYHHDRLTFGLLYAFSENFVLPLSHDEVVHGKGSLIARMPGDAWQRMANLRLLYTWMWTHPGKKLLFMGGEFAQEREWNHDAELDWPLCDDPARQGVMRLVADLNALHRSRTPLHRYDFEAQGFEWIDCHDADQSVLSFLRRDGERFVVVVLNFTPVPRHGYRLGVPHAGRYREILNSDSALYGGSNLGNAGAVEAEPVPWMGRPASLVLTLPPLAGLVLEPEADA